MVEASGKRLLVDCGLFEGTKDLRQRNRQMGIVRIDADMRFKERSLVVREFCDMICG